MAGRLQHSPADVIRYMLIQHGLGTLHSGSGVPDNWTIFSDVEPDRPDAVITVYNTMGVKHAQIHVTREVIEDEGIQIRVRSRTPAEGYEKANAIANELDEFVLQETVTIGTSVYCVHSFNRTSNVIPFPKDSQTPSARMVHVFNGLVTLKQKTQGTGTII